MDQPPQLIGAIYMPPAGGEWGDFGLNGELVETEFEFTSVGFCGTDDTRVREHNLEVCHSCGARKSSPGGIFCWHCARAHVHCFRCYDVSDSRGIPCPLCNRGSVQKNPPMVEDIGFLMPPVPHLEYNSVNNWSHLPTNDSHWSQWSSALEIVGRSFLPPQPDVCRHSDAVKHLCPRCSP
jgi:hypothetical protein